MLVRTSAENRLVLSGGAANVYHSERGEGAVLKEALVQMGIDMQYVSIDSVSRNTHENAIETSRLFDTLRYSKRIVLVTSAWHMKRAQKCFAKQGFDVLPLHTDHLSPTEPLVWHDYVIPSAATLSGWELLIREWVGLLVYWAKGFA